MASSTPATAAKAVANHLAHVPSYARTATSSGTTGGRSSTAAGWTARPGCCASPPTPDRPSGSPAALWSAMPASGCRASSAKLGLTRELRPGQRLRVRAAAVQWPCKATPMLSEPEHLAWRNTLLDRITGPQLQAIVAFGGQAQARSSCGTNMPAVPLLQSRRTRRAATHAQLVDGVARADHRRCAQVVTPDPDGDHTGPNYGAEVQRVRLRPIPPRDLPFGVPRWLGDDAWGRTGQAASTTTAWIARPTTCCTP